MSSRPKTIAFFGATGGCTLACLALALNAGHQCVALARTPTKLESQLQKRGVPPDIITKHLTIVKGDVKDSAAVKKVLSTHPTLDAIIGGIGGTPTFRLNLFKPCTITDPSICADAVASIVSGVGTLSQTQKPLLVVILSPGVDDRDPAGAWRDVPMLLMPLYWYMLRDMFADKTAAHTKLEGYEGDWVSVRPSLLTDGKSLGLEKVREGGGFTVSRDDVGLWIFEKLIQNRGKGYERKSVSITH